MQILFVKPQSLQISFILDLTLTEYKLYFGL